MNYFDLSLCNAENFNIFPVDIEQFIRNELFTTENIEINATILDPIINQLNSNKNWTTENLNCLNELNEIADAINNFEEWAMESMFFVEFKLSFWKLREFIVFSFL